MLHTVNSLPVLAQQKPTQEVLPPNLQALLPITKPDQFSPVFGARRSDPPVTRQQVNEAWREYDKRSTAFYTRLIGCDKLAVRLKILDQEINRLAREQTRLSRPVIRALNKMERLEDSGQQGSAAYLAAKNKLDRHKPAYDEKSKVFEPAMSRYRAMNDRLAELFEALKPFEQAATQQRIRARKLEAAYELQPRSVRRALSRSARPQPKVSVPPMPHVVTQDLIAEALATVQRAVAEKERLLRDVTSILDESQSLATQRREAKLAKTRAETQLDKAQSELKRLALRRFRKVTQEDLDRVEARVDQAQVHFRMSAGRWLELLTDSTHTLDRTNPFIEAAQQAEARELAWKAYAEQLREQLERQGR